MNAKDNLYVCAADICLSTEYWPPEYDRVSIHVEVDRPVRTINLDEYTKKVQDDMMEALRETINITDLGERKKILGEGRSYFTQLVKESSGHEFMERYEKWKSDEDLKREQIEAAKKLLIENGFKVVKETK